MAEVRDTQDLLEQIREECLGSYRSQPGRLDGDIGNESENQSNYHGRFIYELVQNADDVLDDHEERRARFELHEERLFMAHSGQPFTEEHVRALCILGLSSKSDEHATIGQKGRGFTSVLEITNSPAAYSTTYNFQFDRQQAYRTVRAELDLDRDLEPGDVPVLTLPFAPEGRPDYVERLLADDSPFTTVFEFELREGRYETIKRRLTDLNPQIMLFLRHLERLEIVIDGEELVWNLTRIENDEQAASDVEVSRIDISCDGTDAEWGPGSERHQFVKFRKPDIEIQQRGGLEGPHWKAVEYTEVGAALRYQKENGEIHLRPFEEVPEIHLFLPTEEPSPYPVLINGAFKPDSSRTGIPIVDEDGGYNAFLLDQLAELFAETILGYSAATGTTVDDFLSCITPQTELIEGSAASYLKEALADELRPKRFLPAVDETIDCQVAADRLAPEDVILPFSHGEARWIGAEIADIYGPESIPEAIDPQRRKFPASELLDDTGILTLRSIGVDELDLGEIPPVLANAPSDRASLRPFSEVGLRRKVDPVLNVLIGIDSVINADEDRERFYASCQDSSVFPISVRESGEITRTLTESMNLLFPPEDFELSLEFEGVEFLAPAVYRPKGWTRPRGEHGDVDDFQSDLTSIWDVDTFDFQSFAQAVILPRLPRSRRSRGDQSDLQSTTQLRIIKELAGETVKPSRPLPHEPRKEQELYRLCMLPVPTKEDGWAPAYKVYFGPEWFEESRPPRASPLKILQECPSVDPPVLCPPDRLITGNEERVDSAAEVTEDQSEISPRDIWFEFFQWLGVTPHLRLTPLFDPRSEREYGATEDIGRPSADHPTLGALPESTWRRFRNQLIDSVKTSAADEREYLSLFRVNRLEFWPAIRDAARSNHDVAVDLFCHLAHWWEARFSEMSSAGVGGHSVRARQVGARNKGVPNSTERYSIGQNLWLWELREADWCPSIHGRFQPTRVWQRTQALIDQFTIDKRGLVLLPVLDNNIYDILGTPPEGYCRALGIRATIASSDFKPADAQLVCQLLADFADSASDEEIESTLPTLRTAYRELAQVMPSRQREEPPEIWQDSVDDLSSTSIVCEITAGTYDVRPAENAFYVTSRGERRQIPISEPPVFILQENEAGAFGRFFGLKQLRRAVETQLNNSGSDTRPELTESAREFLETRADSLRCLFLRDRPSQRENDADNLNRFIEEMTAIESLIVTYRLDELEEHSAQAWYISSPERAGERRIPYISAKPDDELSDIVDAIARALCEFLDYPNIGDVVLVLRAGTVSERRRMLELLDAPQELIEDAEGPSSGGEFNIGLGTVENRRAESSSTIDSMMEGTVSTEGVDGGSSEADRANRTEGTDPAERLWNPENLVIELEDGSEIEGAAVDTSRLPSSSGTSGSAGGSKSTHRSTPSTGGIRAAINNYGRDLAYSFECSRLRNAMGVDQPEDYVFVVEDRSHIERARKDLRAKPVLSWLTDEIGLDWTYPGFDFLTVHPDSSEMDPKIDRLIEVKSLKEDGPVNISQNEWYTANIEELSPEYYIYVVADLGLESNGYPFIRTVKNPAETLQARQQEQTSISLEVDTKRITRGGTVREYPMRETGE